MYDICFFRWVEKSGYLVATIGKLKEVLQKVHLRRIIVEIKHAEGTDYFFIFFCDEILTVKN